MRSDAFRHNIYVRLQGIKRKENLDRSDRQLDHFRKNVVMLFIFGSLFRSLAIYQYCLFSLSGAGCGLDLQMLPAPYLDKSHVVDAVH